jgi:hypothetical protein
MSPLFASTAGPVHVELGMAANCVGPAKIYWADRSEVFAGSRATEFATKGCDGSGSAAFFRYRAALPVSARVARLMLSPCRTTVPNDYKRRIEIDFVRVVPE